MRQASQFSLIGLFVLAAITIAWFASNFLLPIVAATILYLLLRPVVVWLVRWRVPRAASAALVLLLASVGLGVGVDQLRGPAIEWLERAPEIAFELRYKLAELREPVEKAQEASKQVERITSIGSAASEPQEVVVKPPGLLAQMSDNLLPVLSGLVVTLFLLYFMLATGDELFVMLISWSPAVNSKVQAFELLARIQGDVSSYLATICLINAGLGLCLWGALTIVALPNAALWAAMAACLNFIPFVGPLVCIVVLTLVSILSFDGLGAAVLPPIVYALLNTLEGQLVTPALVGHRLAINPLAVILAVVFGMALWSVAGAMLALPLLICARVVIDNAFPRGSDAADMLGNVSDDPETTDGAPRRAV